MKPAEPNSVLRPSEFLSNFSIASLFEKYTKHFTKLERTFNENREIYIFFRETICHREINIFGVSIVDSLVSKSYVNFIVLRQEKSFYCGA